MRLTLDHHYATAIAVGLRERGRDVVQASERGWETGDDETLLTHCAGESRALLTNNVADFAVIARRWAADGRSHFGLIFTADSSMPRYRRTIARYLTALGALMNENEDDDALMDRVQWL